MKHQALFPEKDKSKKIKCLLLQFSLGTLRVKEESLETHAEARKFALRYQ